MKNRLFFLTILLLLPVLAWGSPVIPSKLTGKVVDSENGEPLPGANVFIEGTTLGPPRDCLAEFNL